MKVIAQKAGLSVSSVSRALKGNPSIPESTQSRVKKIAAELGWRPDPRLTQLMTYLRKDKTTNLTCNLGWLNTWGNPGEMKEPWNRDYLIGAQERAAEMGFVLDEIDAKDFKSRPSSINRILKSRGIEGLILPQLWAENDVVKSLDWQSYATVMIDFYSRDQRGARVAPHYYANAKLMIKKAYDLGYRRPALWMTDFVHPRADHAYSAYFQWAQTRWFEKPHLPIIPSNEIELDVYLKKYQPDVLLVYSNLVLPELLTLGYRVPEDIGLIHHNLADDVKGWAGIDQRHLEIGASAVDSLVAQLQRHELGVSRAGKEIVIFGEWRDGFTICQQPKK